MKPPYEITAEILKSITSISEKIGAINANYLNKPSPKLRKENRIKTIHATLKIEGNTLSKDQITALIEKKRVLGPKKDISEVINAISLYENLKHYNPFEEDSFLKAHSELMQNLIDTPGAYRTENVGVIKGSEVQHLAPSFKNVPFLMKDLFDYLKHSKDIALIKSCVFHYEVEFIHPFLDGNGRMGRLWQTRILMDNYPVFEFIPFETLISTSQDTYHDALAKSDKAGNSTVFIAYMLNVIEDALSKLLNFNSQTLSDLERLNYFLFQNKNDFTRKDYMNVFKTISSATASRDLKKGVELKLLIKTGEKNKTLYKVAN